MQAITFELREEKKNLDAFERLLSRFDLYNAKVLMADEYAGIIPKTSNKKGFYWEDALHPILYKTNKDLGVTTIGQNFELHEKQRFLVISGPNAGGKSITLKTVGLLQVMYQAALFVPVKDVSEFCWFDQLMSDIGDNQSIENQLSTYSYRLKQMNYFLKKCNKNTLFLIDEFGTGSDPELGGSLAETFLEVFYDRKAFGIITTHYSNLKLLANELPHMRNANMLFNERTLEPIYKLVIGEAGSSFTFEVAQKNGIPFSLINKAKKRVETEKVRLDKTISKLQKERNRLQKNSDNLEKQKSKGQEHLENLQEKEQRIQDKLAGFQELYDNNQRMLSLGRKINELLNKYFQTNNKKELNANFNKWVVDEKVKHAKKNPIKPKTKSQKQKAKIVAKQMKETIEKVEKEVLEKVVEVRKEKKKEAVKIAEQKAAYTFKLNDRVKIIDSNSVGTIDKVEKKNVIINYGIFTTKTSVDKLELVERAKN